jgi:hypothetical protein
MMRFTIACAALPVIVASPHLRLLVAGLPDCC